MARNATRINFDNLLQKQKGDYLLKFLHEEIK